MIDSVLDVPAARAAAIAAEYPLEAYPSPTVALSALVSDASFACPALQMDLLTSKYVPTFAYELNDDSAPLRYDPPVTGPRVATHKSGGSRAYLFDLPDAPFQEPFSPGSQALAASMRAAWASFAASGNPSTADAPWPAFDADSMQTLSSAATAAGRDGLRHQAPLRVLGRRVTTHRERHRHYGHQPGG